MGKQLQLIMNVMFDFRLQETIVYTIGELGKEAEEDLLLVVIVSLLETLLSKTKMISSLAFTQVGDDMVMMMVMIMVVVTVMVITWFF